MGSLGLMNGAGVGGVYSAKMRVTERKREERKKKRNKRKEIDPIFHQAKRVENFNLDSRFLQHPSKRYNWHQTKWLYHLPANCGKEKKIRTSIGPGSSNNSLPFSRVRVYVYLLQC